MIDGKDFGRNNGRGKEKKSLDFKDFFKGYLKVEDCQFDFRIEELRQVQIFFQVFSFGEQVFCNIVWRE